MNETKVEIKNEEKKKSSNIQEQFKSTKKVCNINVTLIDSKIIYANYLSTHLTKSYQNRLSKRLRHKFGL
jgi:hypothetical protein